MVKGKTDPLNNVEEKALKSVKKIVPNENDVLCGRGSRSYFHPGNKLFRTIVGHRKASYNDCVNKFKPGIAAEVVHLIKKQNPPGRFLSEDKTTKHWYEIPFNAAVQKTQQALREKTKWTKNDKECQFIEGTKEKSVDEMSTKKNSFENVAANGASTISEQHSGNSSEVQDSDSVENHHVDPKCHIANISIPFISPHHQSIKNSIGRMTGVQEMRNVTEQRHYPNGHLMHELNPPERNIDEQTSVLPMLSRNITPPSIDKDENTLKSAVAMINHERNQTKVADAAHSSNITNFDRSEQQHQQQQYNASNQSEMVQIDDYEGLRCNSFMYQLLYESFGSI